MLIKEDQMKRTEANSSLIWVVSVLIAACFTVVAAYGQTPAEVSGALGMAIVSLVVAVSNWTGARREE